MPKSPDAFRTISEVSEWLDVPAHVLRFWESKFTQVKPVKRAGGRRYYRPSDMELLGGIKTLLYEDGLTIRGVQKKLREDGVRAIAALSTPVDGDEAVDLELTAEPIGPPDVRPEPVAEAEAEPVAEEVAPEPEPVSDADQPEADPEPTPEPESTATTEPEPQPEPVVEAPEPEPEATSETPDPEPELQPVADASEPEPQPASEPEADQTTALDSAPSDPAPSDGSEPDAEPEPDAAPELEYELEPDVADILTADYTLTPTDPPAPRADMADVSAASADPEQADPPTEPEATAPEVETEAPKPPLGSDIPADPPDPTPATGDLPSTVATHLRGLDSLPPEMDRVRIITMRAKLKQLRDRLAADPSEDIGQNS